MFLTGIKGNGGAASHAPHWQRQGADAARRRVLSA